MELETISVEKPRLEVKFSARDKAPETFEQDVLKGLSANPKYLQPKYLYDKIGSQLFEQICELPEYYPTRTEASILEKYNGEIADLSTEDTVLIELGSGSSTKTLLVIEAFLEEHGKLHYIPIDISKSILVDTANSLLKEYDNLRVTAMVSDYITALQALRQEDYSRKLILFLGSSIGNFNKQERERFLQETQKTMTEDDRILIGLDMLKDKSILEPAYDDSQGVTAQFTLNILRRINNELDGEFDLSKFKHKAFLNTEEHRIEAHIESLETQDIRIGQLDRTFHFENGETIHTESSYKFSPEDVQEMADHAGFKIEHVWFDDEKWFSLNLLQPA